MQRWILRFGFQAIVSLADSVVSRAHLSFLQPLQLFLLRGLRGQGLNRQALPQALDGLCQWVQWSFWSTKNKKIHLYAFISILLLLLLTRIKQLRCPHSVPSKNNTSHPLGEKIKTPGSPRGPYQDDLLLFVGNPRSLLQGSASQGA